MNFDDSFAVLPDCYPPCFQTRVPGLCYEQIHERKAHFEFISYLGVALALQSWNKTKISNSAMDKSDKYFWYDLLCFIWVSKILEINSTSTAFVFAADFGPDILLVDKNAALPMFYMVASTAGGY